MLAGILILSYQGPSEVLKAAFLDRRRSRARPQLWPSSLNEKCHEESILWGASLTERYHVEQP